VWRQTVVACLGLALVSLYVFAILRHPLVGPGVWIGVALGAANSRLFQVAASRLATVEGGFQRRPFVGGVLLRLGGVSAVALVLVALVPPIGWGALVGVALFQMLFLAISSKTVLHQRKASEENYLGGTSTPSSVVEGQAASGRPSSFPADAQELPRKAQ